MDDINQNKIDLENERATTKRLQELLEERTQDLMLVKDELQLNYDEMRRYVGESALMFSLSRLSHGDFKVSDALQIFIDGVCKLKGWEIGHIYTVIKDDHQNKTVLSASNIWYFSNEEKYQMFKEVTHNSCSKSELAVSKSGFDLHKQIKDIIDNESLSRTKVLRHYELQGLYGVPIIIYGKMIALAEFFSTKKILVDNQMVGMIATVANQLGLMLERRHNEKQLEKNYHELEKIHQELKTTQTQLLQSSNLISIGQLAAGIAHEINTPIQYIANNSQFLQDSFKNIIALIKETQALIESIDFSHDIKKHAELEAVKKHFDDLSIDLLFNEIGEAISHSLKGVDHVSKIVKSMKELSHPGSTERTPADINHALENALIVSKNEWKYVADIKCNLDPNLPLVFCIPNEINQVFLNLISNAAHAIEAKVQSQSSKKGVIEIQTKSDKHCVEVMISDSGIGITDEIKDRVFEPFFTTKEVGKGTGQGLSIAHAIVVGKHKGLLSFNSKVDKGTQFIIRLPIN